MIVGLTHISVDIDDVCLFVINEISKLYAKVLVLTLSTTIFLKLLGCCLPQPKESLAKLVITFWFVV